jgi:DNA-directed RNA polymerase beta' subunit
MNNLNKTELLNSNPVTNNTGLNLIRKLVSSKTAPRLEPSDIGYKGRGQLIPEGKTNPNIDVTCPSPTTDLGPIARPSNTRGKKSMREVRLHTAYSLSSLSPNLRDEGLGLGNKETTLVKSSQKQKSYKSKSVKTNFFLNKIYQKNPAVYSNNKAPLAPSGALQTPSNTLPAIAPRPSDFGPSSYQGAVKTKQVLSSSFYYPKSISGYKKVGFANRHEIKIKKQEQVARVFQSSYSKMTEINLITISLASANRIRQWAEKTLPNGKVVGEVINPETVHYKTLKPIKGGLFCERIFGPLKDHECACGKKFNIKNYLTKINLSGATENNLLNSAPAEGTTIDKNNTNEKNPRVPLQKRYFCRICDVEYTYSIIRRTQLGYIQLASPTTHVWFVKGTPSYISILLDMKKKHLQNVTYNTETLTLEHAFRGRQYLPSTPSSIFESWQKIMKTQYPDKYGPQSDTTGKKVTKIGLQSPKTIKGTKMLKGGQLTQSFGVKTKSMLVKQGSLTTVPNKKNVGSLPIVQKSYSTNDTMTSFSNSKNPKKDYEVADIYNKNLYKQNKKRYYSYLKKDQKNESVPLRETTPVITPQNHLQEKHQLFYNKKGWFKLVNKILNPGISVALKGNCSYINKPLPAKLKNLFIAIQNDLQFLQRILIYQQKNNNLNYSVFTGFLKKQNQSIDLTQKFSHVNTILNFYFNNSFSSSPSPKSILYKDQRLLGRTLVSRKAGVPNKKRPVIGSPSAPKERTLVSPQQYVIRNNMLEEHVVSYNLVNCYKHALLKTLKFNTKNLAIPLYLLFLSKQSSKAIAGGGVSEDLPLASICNAPQPEPSLLPHQSILFKNEVVKQTPIGLGSITAVPINFSWPKNHCSKTLLPKAIEVSNDLLNDGVIQLCQVFSKINQKTKLFLSSSKKKCLTTVPKRQVLFIDASNRGYTPSKYRGDTRNHDPRMASILEDPRIRRFLNNLIYCKNKYKTKLDNTKCVFSKQKANLDLFSLQSLLQKPKKQHALFILTKSLKFYNLTFFPNPIKNQSFYWDKGRTLGSRQVRQLVTWAKDKNMVGQHHQGVIKWEKHITKLAVMLVLNLKNYTDLKQGSGKEKPATALQLHFFPKGEKTLINKTPYSKIRFFNHFKNKLKTKLVQRFYACYIFNQSLLPFKQLNCLSRNIPYQLKGAFQPLLSLPVFFSSPPAPLMTKPMVGVLNFIKAKQASCAIKHFGCLKISKILTLYFFFLKQSKQTIAYKLYNSLVADFKKIKNKSLKYLFLSFTLFSYKKQSNLKFRLNMGSMHARNGVNVDALFLGTVVKQTSCQTPLKRLPSPTGVSLITVPHVFMGHPVCKASEDPISTPTYYPTYTSQSEHERRAYKNERLLGQMLISRQAGVIKVKGNKRTVVKQTMACHLPINFLTKKNILYGFVQVSHTKKYHKFFLTDKNSKITNKQNFYSNVIESNQLTSFKKQNLCLVKTEQLLKFKTLFAKTKNLIVNNIYCLSHRELWEQEKDWQDFAYYYYSPTNITDKAIPLYKHRNYDLLFNIDNTLAYTTTDYFPAQTQLYSLGMNINTAFSGAGLIQKLLNEFNYSELKKMDKQNRILLFEYNKHIKKLKKMMNSRLMKSRLEYYKACHIRDVLIRRTKLTRKIFNKVIPNDAFANKTGKSVANKNLSNTTKTRISPSIIKSSTNAVFPLGETNGLNMILTLLPVLPPVLRPVLKMSGQFTISDLNRLYQRIIYRNERLKKFLKDPALSSSFEMKYAQRLLQEAVDNLIQNGKSGVVPEKDARGRLLKSLSDILKGKQGRFRQYLLGKRVDYSGRSVIVVGPRLKLHECGIPKEMALVLYSPFLIKRILNEKLADTYLSAKKLIRTNPLLVSQLLREIMKSCPVLLNRAPTLHRLGFQAFQPKLVDGKAILLHPLVCPAFNADFDGDQMAVHVPITFEARAEAWKLMLARNNLLSPATGEPLILPSQDMVLGCYYLTTYCDEKWSNLKKGSGMYFHSINDVLKAYNQQLIHIHAVIWVNIKGHVETGNTVEQPLEIRVPLNQFLYTRKDNASPFRLSALEKKGRHQKANSVRQLNNEEVVNTYLNYIEIYSKSHNVLNLKRTNTSYYITFTKGAADGVSPREARKEQNRVMHLPNLTNQIIRTTPGKILFNMLIKNAIEKRPALLSKYSYGTGLVKKKLINTFDLQIDNFFMRKKLIKNNM